MIKRDLTPGARFYIGSVILLGALTGGYLIGTVEYGEGDWLPLVLFGGLGFLSSTITITYQGSMPTRVAHQIGSAFVYPLLLLVHPGTVCLMLLAVTATDALIYRRRLTNSAFNVCQLLLSVWLAVQVRGLLLSEPAPLPLLEERVAVVGALAMLMVFALTNHGLTQGVISLVARRPFFHWSLFTKNGLLTETLCVVSGLGMAVLWQVEPWLVFLGVVPVWTTIFMVAALSRREQELENRETELHSLQGLGLELGSVLDAERLYDAVLRSACEALETSGAVLAEADARLGRLAFLGARGIETPADLPLDGLRHLLGGERPVRLPRLPAARDVRPEQLDFLGDREVLVAPLKIQNRRTGLLILRHGAERRPFNDDDSRRLETLVRFINVALSNARLVTERKEIESRLVQSEKMSALGMLVSGVAHELNNPLTSVMGYAELLAERESEDPKLKALERIAIETKRASRIVQSLLTFSRKHKTERTLVDINEIICEILEFRSYELQVRNIELTRLLGRDLPPVRVDAHQFQQVVLNLISNAEQALIDRRRSGRITVESHVEEGLVVFSVTDNGPGIPRDHMNQLFVPFFTSKDVGQGTGLGLSICYGIVEEHGGSIEVSSREGFGARFTVRVPIAERAVEAPKRLGERAEKQIAATGGRVLIVDDEPSILEMLSEFFRKSGWSVSTASDGVQALETVGTDSQFDALLVDLRMAGMDGQLFFERLKRVRPELVSKVVFATGDSSHVSSAHFLAGVDNQVLSKPFSLGQLAGAIARLPKATERL